ncbi:MAG TPA: DNA recombination protein RmuC [Anaeromyxobacteraceae bacterium]|nr:DNA recombination protein RmuC [Anaeromyxobacteraceae bacterium]
MEIALLALCALAAAGSVALALALPGRIASGVRASLGERLDAHDRALAATDRLLREELARAREESGTAARGLRDELRGALHDGREASARSLTAFGTQIDKLSAANEARLEALRGVVDARLRGLQEESAKRLEEMRLTVDEKLQGTLEKRLGDSFRLVSERLEAVQRGLGEMQTLANGVGDLKKVLTNVKVRGTWGEIQLGSLLEQILAPEQFVKNVATRPGSLERVEFAIRLPGRGDDGQGEVLLPIDAKFPLEDYQRIVEASERGDAAGVEAAARQLEARLEGCARDIHQKYVNPPYTTDFGLLYLPTEGLYAEVTRRPGLLEVLQREHRVSVAGPTTLAALLNSLQMGFRTLAIQQRSSEVWQVLGGVKAELGKFGEVLAKVEKKLAEASTTLELVATRRRVLERKLKTVEIPAAQADALLFQAAAVEVGQDE